MAAPQITPLPTPPIRSDAPADFSTKADAFVAALPGFVTQANAQADFNDQRAIDSDASATAAADSEAAVEADRAEVATNTATVASNTATVVASADEVADNALQVAADTQQVSDDRAAVDAALASIAGGPVYSVNGMTGAVTGVATQAGAETLTNKTLADPIVALGGSQGVAGQVPVSQGVGLPPVWGSLNTSPQIMIVQQQGPSGSSGGIANPGVWEKRLLNTVVQNSIPGASLAANSITLPAGTYVVQAVAQAGAVSSNKIKIYNETDSADLVIGHSANSGAVEFKSIPSPLSGAFTLAGTKQISLRHRADTQSSNTDFGFPSGYGVAEVFAHIHLERI